MDTKIALHTPRCGSISLTPAALAMMIAYVAFLASEGYTGRAALVAWDAYDAAVTIGRPDIAVAALNTLRTL